MFIRLASYIIILISDCETLGSNIGSSVDTERIQHLILTMCSITTLFASFSLRDKDGKQMRMLNKKDKEETKAKSSVSSNLLYSHRSNLMGGLEIFIYLIFYRLIFLAIRFKKITQVYLRFQYQILLTLGLPIELSL